jgi:phage repressor protein C with HTH and peptisase S24 domain
VISHARIWSAIDALAARNGMSASGLARRAGLDPTAFNKSKRVGSGGRLRWPSTESLAKVLTATNTSAEELATLIGKEERKGAETPMDDPPAPGFYVGDAAMAAVRATVARRVPTLLYEVSAPGIPPLYRAGDRLLLDPAEPIVAGARIVAVDNDGVVLAGEVTAWADELSLAIPGQEEKIRRQRRDVAFAARIIWASQ